MREISSRYDGIYEEREKKENSTESAGQVLVKQKRFLCQHVFMEKDLVFGLLSKRRKH